MRDAARVCLLQGAQSSSILIEPLEWKLSKTLTDKVSPPLQQDELVVGGKEGSGLWLGGGMGGRSDGHLYLTFVCGIKMC